MGIEASSVMKVGMDGEITQNKRNKSNFQTQLPSSNKHQIQNPHLNPGLSILRFHNSEHLRNLVYFMVYFFADLKTSA